jgi:hypothetical protein
MPEKGSHRQRKHPNIDGIITVATPEGTAKYAKYAKFSHPTLHSDAVQI